MQAREASHLRKMWGDVPCDHDHVEKEYDLGSDTGDLVCTQCGRTFWGDQLEELRKKKDDNKK